MARGKGMDAMGGKRTQPMGKKKRESSLLLFIIYYRRDLFRSLRVECQALFNNRNYLQTAFLLLLLLAICDIMSQWNACVVPGLLKNTRDIVMYAMPMDANRNRGSALDDFEEYRKNQDLGSRLLSICQASGLNKPWGLGNSCLVGQKHGTVDKRQQTWSCLKINREKGGRLSEGVVRVWLTLVLVRARALLPVEFGTFGEKDDLLLLFAPPGVKRELQKRPAELGGGVQSSRASRNFNVQIPIFSLALC
ncbi:hypothetical protein QBC36DRAFT_358804 [Triangularia setosa]|uniref:Uncharacterized protein n=1 Tax=Triangularia setosa TaxID=2587417 RepID=A0AAN6WH66_9PEZI|nr:hypothetical protein QBC36DRAFT_358804 [Podospora setosa]